MKELSVDQSWIQQDIKTIKITPEQLEELKKMAGSYEALFSRTAMKYKSMGLRDKILSENDYKDLILEEYTFLKRPIIIYNREIFIGNSIKTIEAANSVING